MSAALNTTSPNVNIIEKDNSIISNGVGINTTFFAGYFHRGQIDTPIKFNSDIDFKHYYGIFDSTNYNDWYQCYNYLQYSNNLIITRSVNKQKDLFNSYASFPNRDGNISILNETDYLSKNNELIFDSNNIIKFVARTPGNWGNKLNVGLFTLKEFYDNETIYNITKAQDVVTNMEEGDYCIVVFYNNTIVEVFNKAFNKVEDINQESKYVYVQSRLFDYILKDGNVYYIDGIDGNWDGNDEEIPISVFIGDSLLKLEGGISYPPTLGDIDDAYSDMDREDIKINIIIGNERNNNSAIRLANSRKDCVCIVGFPKIKEKEYLNYKDDLEISEFTCLIANYKKQFDKKTQKDIYVNFAGDIAGLRASIPRVDSHCKSEYTIKNYTGVYLKLKTESINLLFKNNINTVNLRGARLFTISERLNIPKESNLSNLTNRFIFNSIYTESYELLNNFIFEAIDKYTMNDVEIKLKQILSLYKRNNEINNYKIIVTHKADLNTLIVDVILKPNYSIQYIRLRFTNTGTNTISDIAFA